MKVTSEKVLKLKLKGTKVTTFKSVLSKCEKLTTKVGFAGTSFTEKELELIKSLNKEV